MKSKLTIVLISAIVLPATVSTGSVLAYDPFDAAQYADAANGIYDDNTALRLDLNKEVTGGSIVGFGAYAWADSFPQCWFVPVQGSLSSGAVGTNSTGAIGYAGSTNFIYQFSVRQMSTSAPEQVLYLTGLIRTDALEENSAWEGFWMGLTDNNITHFFDNTFDGVMFGFAGDGDSGSLTLKGGGTINKIQDAAVDTTYMVVLKITPNLTGNDRIDVFVNPTSNTEPTFPDLTVINRDYIDSMSDLDYATLYSRSDVAANVMMDELRLTTTFAEAVMLPADGLNGAAALRTLTYNIFTGLVAGDGGGMVSMNAIANVIAVSNPDLVALQEVDKYTSRGNIDQAKVLGELLGMEYRFLKSMDYRGGEYGDALLSRYPIQATYEHSLPPNGGEVRGALEVVVEVPDLYGRTNTLSFVSTHLDHLSDKTRVIQVQAILDALAPRNHPIVLAGDLNAEPKSRPIALLERNGYTPLDSSGAFTFPAVTPTKKIDYIMVKNLPITESNAEVVVETAASDHRPVYAGIAIGAPADWLGSYGLPREALSNFLDSDGDSMDNYSEWWSGTDPTDALSFFGFQSLGSGSVPTGFQLQWNSIIGRTYRIKASTNLVDGAFQTLEGGIQGWEGTTEYIDTNATEKGRAFYQIHVE